MFRPSRPMMRPLRSSLATGTTETVYGYGTLSGYTESIEAGSIVSWESTVTGYGPYVLDVDSN